MSMDINKNLEYIVSSYESCKQELKEREYGENSIPDSQRERLFD